MKFFHKRRMIFSSITILLLLFSLSYMSSVFANPPFAVTSQAHVENTGWINTGNLNDSLIIGTTGEHKKLEALKFSAENPQEFGIECQAHIENIGWQKPVGNGEQAGVTGEDNGIEAVRLKGTGASADNYDLYYRAHVESYGWTDWAKDNNPVGSEGQDRQIEAVQIKVVPKDETPELESGDVSWSYLSDKDTDYTTLLTLTNTYPHNEESFTEGLSFYNGKLYESAGLYGSSTLEKNIDLKTAKAEVTKNIDSDLFAEGSVVLDGKLYMLTYKEHKVQIFDPETLELLETKPYPDREGWGLTTDGENLIASDGSSKIYFMNPDVEDIKTLTVTYQGQEIDQINELEYIDGAIWANIWYSDDVIIINKDTGEVMKRIDFSDIRPESGEVLNGIAYNPENGKLYLTGKNWPKLFEFEFKSDN